MHNAVILIGRVGTDIKMYGSDIAISGTFRMATNKKWKDKEGIWKEETQWHSIVVCGPAAVRLDEKIGKGDMVVVTGELKYREFEKSGIKVNIAEVYGNAKRLIKAKDEVQSTIS
jgi:single-strand DNA-binding protein